jgi:hypothetical protein
MKTVMAGSDIADREADPGQQEEAESEAGAAYFQGHGSGGRGSSHKIRYQQTVPNSLRQQAFPQILELSHLLMLDAVSAC